MFAYCWIRIDFNLLYVKRSSSEDFVKSLDLNSMIPENHRLASWDYSSMFTNIPFSVAKKIIADNYVVVAEETSFPVNLFLESIAMLVEHSSYFTYKQKIYVQPVIKGDCWNSDEFLHHECPEISRKSTDIFQ